MMSKRDKTTALPFTGFDPPISNWFRMPNSWTDMTADISSIAELKVVEYILRHTWGYSEYGVKKHITIDEFVHGRHRLDGGRLDRGTGLSERAVYDGLRKALEDGLIEEDIDSSDRGRVKKRYSLRMREELEENPDFELLQSLQTGVQSLHPPQQSLQASGAKFAPRSKKDTLERHYVERTSSTRKGSRSNLSENDGDDQPARLQEKAAPREETMLLSDVLARRAAAAGVLSAPPVSAPAARVRRAKPARFDQQDEDYQIIQAYIADFARELNDRASLRVSTVRAYNLFKRSGLTRQDFLEQLYAARAIVKERSAQIRDTGETGPLGTPAKHRAAYYFAVLEDLLGLREETPADN
jgi:DNA-binding PadR family transcriptional regulator